MSEDEIVWLGLSENPTVDKGLSQSDGLCTPLWVIVYAV